MMCMKLTINDRIIYLSIFVEPIYIKPNKAGYTAQDAPSTRLKITRDRRTYGRTYGRTDGRTDGQILL